MPVLSHEPKIVFRRSDRLEDKGTWPLRSSLEDLSGSPAPNMVQQDVRAATAYSHVPAMDGDVLDCGWDDGSCYASAWWIVVMGARPCNDWCGWEVGRVPTKMSLKAIFTRLTIGRVAAFTTKNCTGGFLAIHRLTLAQTYPFCSWWCRIQCFGLAFWHYHLYVETLKNWCR
jgi:hypothetical protein